jgi:hypothetical protein
LFAARFEQEPAELALVLESASGHTYRASASFAWPNLVLELCGRPRPGNQPGERILKG